MYLNICNKDSQDRICRRVISLCSFVSNELNVVHHHCRSCCLRDVTSGGTVIQKDVTDGVRVLTYCICF